MLAARTPVLGVLLAVLVLCVETVSMNAYIELRRRTDDSIAMRRARAATEQAMRDAVAAKVRLDELMHQLDRLDTEIEQLHTITATLPTPSDLRDHVARTQRELKLIRDDLDDSLVIPTSGPSRGFDRPADRPF